MSTAARKARKRAGERHVREQKVPTPRRERVRQMSPQREEQVMLRMLRVISEMSGRGLWR